MFLFALRLLVRIDYLHFTNEFAGIGKLDSKKCIFFVVFVGDAFPTWDHPKNDSIVQAPKDGFERLTAHQKYIIRLHAVNVYAMP